MQGLVVKVDTSDAIRQEQALKAAAEATTAALGRQQQQAKALVDEFAGLGRSAGVAAKTASDRQAQSAFSASIGVGARALPGSTSTDVLLGGQVKNTQALKKGVEELGAASRKASQDTAGLVQNQGALATAVQKVLNVAGAGGAAKGVGLLSSAFKVLGSTINPLGIGLGILSGAIVTWIASSASAETATERLRRQAREAQDDFSNLSASIERTTSALAAVGQARQIGKPYEGVAQEADRLKGVLDSISAAQTTISEQARRSPGADGFELTIEQIKELGEALQEPAFFFRDLEAAAKNSGRESDRAFARLQARIGLQRQDGVLTLSSADAQKALAESYRQTRYAIDENAKALRSLREFETERKIGDIGRDQQQSIADEALGNREREATIRLRQVQAGINRELTPTEKELANAVLASARAEDANKIATEKATKAKEQAAEIARQQAAEQAALVKTYEDSIQGLQRETYLLAFEGDEREAMRLQIELEAKARATNVKDMEREQGVIQRTVSFLIQARARDRERKQADRENAQLDARRVDVLRELNDETAILLARTDKEVKEKRLLAEVNRRLAETGLRPGEDGAREIEDAVKRNRAAEEYQRTLERIGEAGEQLGAEVGAGFADAAFAAGKFSSNLAAVGRALAELEAKKAIAAAFAAAFKAIGQAFVSQPASNTGSPSAVGAPRGEEFQARGGLLGRGADVLAARGMIFQQFTTITQGGRRVGVAEGGAATPEAVVPLARDRFGRLGLAAPAGGGGMALAMHFHGVSTARQASDLRPTALQMAGEYERARGRYAGSRR